jgi:glutathione S-transferase
VLSRLCAGITSFSFTLLFFVIAADPTGPLVHGDRADLPGLDAYLLRRSYMRGFTPSQDDVILYNLLQANKTDVAAYPSVKRWQKHIASFPATDRGSWPA